MSTSERDHAHTTQSGEQSSFPDLNTFIERIEERMNNPNIEWSKHDDRSDENALSRADAFAGLVSQMHSRFSFKTAESCDELVRSLGKQFDRQDASLGLRRLKIIQDRKGMEPMGALDVSLAGGDDRPSRPEFSKALEVLRSGNEDIDPQEGLLFDQDTVGLSFAPASVTEPFRHIIERRRELVASGLSSENDDISRTIEQGSVNIPADQLEQQGDIAWPESGKKQRRGRDDPSKDTNR